MSLSQHQKEIETSPQDSPSKIPQAGLFVFSRKMTLGEMNPISKASTIGKLILLRKNCIQCVYCQVFRAIPHNSKCQYGERGAAAAKPKAQIILCAAKVSAAGGGYSEPKQGQRSQSARGFCPRSTSNPTLSSILATQMPCRTPSRSEALRSATDALRRLLARRSAGAVLKL